MYHVYRVDSMQFLSALTVDCVHYTVQCGNWEPLASEKQRKRIRNKKEVLKRAYYPNSEGYEGNCKLLALLGLTTIISTIQYRRQRIQPSSIQWVMIISMVSLTNQLNIAL